MTGQPSPVLDDSAFSVSIQRFSPAFPVRKILFTDLHNIQQQTILQVNDTFSIKSSFQFVDMNESISQRISRTVMAISQS